MTLTHFDPAMLNKLFVPATSSHKGDNGRVLVIGGSKLFHASIFWAAQAASKFVDLVHFSSPANENNDLVRYRLKQGFWEGIVVDWGDIEHYITEDDCILIGPGMPRDEGLYPGETPTSHIVNSLLQKYADKRWVIDGGALQEVDPSLFNQNHIITPHRGEWERLVGEKHEAGSMKHAESTEDQTEGVKEFSRTHNGVTILLKGEKDIVCRGDELVVIEGGNAGMTKGGTGDVLAGVVAALYCKNDAFIAAQAGSYLTKQAGEKAFEKKGFWFGAGELINELRKISEPI